MKNPYDGDKFGYVLRPYRFLTDPAKNPKGKHYVVGAMYGEGQNVSDVVAAGFQKTVPTLDLKLRWPTEPIATSWMVKKHPRRVLKGKS